MKENVKNALISGVVGALVVTAAFTAAGVAGVIPLATDARLHNYLLSHPAVVFEMAEKAQLDEVSKAASARQKVVDKLGQKAFFDPAIAYVTGPANAKNTFVEFFDYNCVHCRNSFAAVKRFYDAHKNDTRFAFIEMPINGPESSMAARAAIAARTQGDKYLALHFLLMGEKGAIDTALLQQDLQKAGVDLNKLTTDMSAAATEKAIVAARKLATDAQVSGTPAFIVNGKFHDGEITDADFKRLMK